MEEKNKKQNKKEESKCPLCEVSEEALKILKEKGRKDKIKEKPKDDGK